jgi:hypothetical protein
MLGFCTTVVKNQQCTIVARNGIFYVQTIQQSVFVVEGKSDAIQWKTKVRIVLGQVRGVEARALLDSFNAVATAGAGILWA